MTRTEAAETAAREVLVFSRRTGQAVTRRLVDECLSADASMPWGSASPTTVVRQIKALAIPSDRLELS